MKFSLDQNASAYLDRLVRQYELNLESSDFYNSFLTNCYDWIDRETVMRISKECHVSLQNAYFNAMLAALDMDPDDGELTALVKHNHIDVVTKLEKSAYTNDPYIKNICPKPMKIGSVSLEYNTFYPYEGFLYDSSYTRGERFPEYVRLGFFESPFRYLQISQDDNVWMLMTSYEINTMRHDIEEARGNVITFGLGLGYYAYMAALKKDVTKVTVVEKDPAVIEIFEKAILPLTGLENKIEIIEADAYDYIERGMKAKHYDVAYVDIYRQATDGLYCYLKTKQLAKDIKDCKFVFWIEDEINILLNRFAVSYLADPEADADENDELSELIDLFKEACDNLDIELKTKEDIVFFVGNREYLDDLVNLVK